MGIFQIITVLSTGLAIWDSVVGQIQIDCASFGVNATNVSAALQNWEARLQAYFDAHPYDKRQLPAPQDALPILLAYDWALVTLISFLDGVLKVVLLIQY